jgi:thiamine-phosphate pyrophosphorylase
MFLEYANYQQKQTFFKENVTLYPVSCEPLANGRTDIEWLEGVLDGGAKIVQLRDKISDDRAFFEKALVFRQKTRAAGALFIVNNRFDIALLSEADGVHLGNDDLPCEEVRKLAPELIIGVSCNAVEQAATAAERGASYYNIGPLFQTTTKRKLTPFLGASAIDEFSALCDLPYTVMGGIKLEHVNDLVDRGARRIAVVTALTQADDIAGETRKWIDAISQAGKV